MSLKLKELDQGHTCSGFCFFVSPQTQNSFIVSSYPILQLGFSDVSLFKTEMRLCIFFFGRIVTKVAAFLSASLPQSPDSLRCQFAIKWCSIVLAAKATLFFLWELKTALWANLWGHANIVSLLASQSEHVSCLDYYYHNWHVAFF